jgi:hypothetical protein
LLQPYFPIDQSSATTPAGFVGQCWVLPWGTSIMGGDHVSIGFGPVTGDAGAILRGPPRHCTSFATGALYTARSKGPFGESSALVIMSGERRISLSLQACRSRAAQEQSQRFDYDPRRSVVDAHRLTQSISSRSGWLFERPDTRSLCIPWSLTRVYGLCKGQSDRRSTTLLDVRRGIAWPT